LPKGLTAFGKNRNNTSTKEINQLCRRMCFAPLKVKEMKPCERKKAQMALMFLTEKRDKSMKGIMVYKRKPTRDSYLKKIRRYSEPNGGAREYHDDKSDQSKRRKRHYDMQYILNPFIQVLLPTKEPGEDRV
jgi:hypothetical protein